MWKWNCPVSNVTSVHHTKEDALKTIEAHEAGYQFGFPYLDIRPCPAEHKLADDGKACYLHNCKFEYVKDEELVLDEAFEKLSGALSLLEVPKDVEEMVYAILDEYLDSF